MGAYCTCETSALDKENLIQYEFGEKEKILSEIKPKLKNFNNAEFISKEEFDKILSSFPNVNELISQFEEKTRQETEQKEDLQTPDTNPPSGRVSHQGTNLIENIEPIKFFGDDEQFTIYNFNIDKDYNFIGKGYQITNNFIYYGYIENNLSNGKGILINKNGSSLFGDWENGQCTGKGTLIIKNILEYDGDFVKNKKEGYGVEKYSDGSTYEGYFQDDKKNGKGKCLLKNGEIYEGEFVNDLYEGEGIYKWPNESREYKGHFTKGVIDGKGINKFSDGSIYDGFYKKGIKHGSGKYTWPNGKICKGNWVNNKLHGNAIFEEGDKIYNITFRFGKIISVSEAIDENKIMKFKLDDIINNEENKEKYACSSCGFLIRNPYKCCNCYKNYCLSCIKGEDGKNKICEDCQEDKYVSNDDLKAELIKNIKVYCNECKTELNYESAIIHIH
jgi:hypothetical protein